jgi:putative hydrolase of the HAD superfamily
MDLAYEAHETGHLDSVEYFASLRTALALDLDDAQLLAGWNDIFLGPTPGMQELVAEAAAHLPVYLFSNTNPMHQTHWTRAYADLLQPFSAVFTSSDLGVRKPSPEAFAAVCERMGVPAEAVLFFDDTAANVDGALAAGLQAVLFRTADDARVALAPLGIGTAA